MVENQGKQAESARVSWQIVDAAGKTVATAEAAAQQVAIDGSATFTATAKLANPALWSVDAPNLYAALVTVEAGGKVRDAERVTFGVRTATFEADKGFFLNGKPLKIQGTCNHQDHAGVGAALPDRLQTFRMAVLKEMGNNAVRTSHNMPTPEWVEACDRMGVMMMCETRQMSSNPEGLAQLETMVKRYRNSPSIILWSIGNEEFTLQEPMAEQGAKIAATMVQRCHELDPTRVVSAAVNGNNEKGVSDPFDIIGFNYNLSGPDGSTRTSQAAALWVGDLQRHLHARGLHRPTRCATRECLRLGGALGRNGRGVVEVLRHAGVGGGRICVDRLRLSRRANALRLAIDQFAVRHCGYVRIPQGHFYYYKAWWGKEPSLHVFPHWNWAGREGDEISCGPTRTWTRWSCS